MKNTIFCFLLVFSTLSCVTRFFPESGDINQFLVVEGLITDQNISNTVFLSKSAPLNANFKRIPVTGLVTITDDLNNINTLREKKPGMFVTDSLKFRGVIGRKYVLKISTQGYSYLSDTIEMKPVPPVNRVEAERILNNNYKLGEATPGYQVYVSTFDSTRQTGYYRWTFSETWEFKLPYSHPTIVNRVCWKSANSKSVFIKNTKSLSEDRIVRFPLNFISAETDRLTVKYSILVKQYSMNENEYSYWENIKKINQASGGLYDIVPVSVKSNIRCISDPELEVLGYFSVSAASEARIFINHDLEGFPDYYKDCPNDTIPSWIPDSRIGKSIFIIMEYMYPGQTIGWPYYIVAIDKKCADCSLSGSKVKPEYWDKNGINPFPRDNYDFRK
jgi:hypothetical protein